MTELLNFAQALASQDAIAWTIFTGACALIALGAAVIAGLMWSVDNYMGNRRWRRLVRVCGSEQSAMKVLEAAETLPVDRLIGMGMQGAARRNWL